MSKELVILGSCVTRDPVELGGLRNSLSYYHCRSNLASLTSPTPLGGTFDFSSFSPFQQRCFKNDLAKTFKTGFEGCVVVFDFIDDRFPIATKEGSVFTYNPLLASSNPEVYNGAHIVRHFDKQHWALVETIAHDFAAAYRELFQNNVTVLHEATFSRFWDGSNPAADYCAAMIDYYIFLFELLKDVLPFNHVVNCMEAITNSDGTPRSHRWGHAPFHYSDEYNSRFATALTSIVNA